MTKTELINEVANKTELTKKDCEMVVNAVLESITDAMSVGDKVQLTGFGTFEVRDRAAREGKNPATGAPISIPATKVPAFKAGKALKDAVAK